ncbi:MAG TPA: phosphoglucosamine mutase [Acidobacteriota bacterium]|nr:phosphoglucosamine mutase [Acidobacteriota bacterium]
MKKRQLIASTSGIRGIVGSGLDPELVAAYGAAFGTLLKNGTVVVGCDTRPSGDMVRRAVTAGLVSVGVNVVDIGVVPTPTVGIAVRELGASGGVCVTASHNPAQWNALKFFNGTGRFITPRQFESLQGILTHRRFAYRPADRLGKFTCWQGWIDRHIKRILSLSILDRPAIKRRKFRVVVDAVNGAGSVALPKLLEKLGVEVFAINCDADGNFVRGPEPVPQNLRQLAQAVQRHQADLGMACDPDADRLALVDERGRPIGEELTLTIAVLEVLKRVHGPTVINLSTSRATADVAKALGSRVSYSKVGESNVVEAMRRKKAVIGGEGNGGVIFPAFHAGRDALIASALVLQALARGTGSLSELAKTFPRYYSIKSKASLPGDFAIRLKRFETKAHRLLGKVKVDRRDGLRFDFADGWLQLRASNTEPIFRLIVETSERQLTRALHAKVMSYFI